MNEIRGTKTSHRNARNFVNENLTKTNSQNGCSEWVSVPTLVSGILFSMDNDQTRNQTKNIISTVNCILHNQVLLECCSIRKPL